MKDDTVQIALTSSNIKPLLKHKKQKQVLHTAKIASCMGPQNQGSWPKINCSQMKLPNFVSSSVEGL